MRWCARAVGARNRASGAAHAAAPRKSSPAPTANILRLAEDISDKLAPVFRSSRGRVARQSVIEYTSLDQLDSIITRFEGAEGASGPAGMPEDHQDN